MQHTKLLVDSEFYNYTCHATTYMMQCLSHVDYFIYVVVQSTSIARQVVGKS